MSLNKHSLFLVIFFAAAFVNPIFADDGDRGRLPDGRAYRTDAEGNQLVDALAESEVTIEGLNRKVISLEDELTQKNQELERVRAGRSEQVAEKDLLGKKAEASPKVAASLQMVSACSVPVACPKCPDAQIASSAPVQCPSVHCPEVVNCAVETQPLKDRVAYLETDLAVQKKLSSNQTEQLGKLAKELDMANRQVSTLETSLKSAESKYQVALVQKNKVENITPRGQAEPPAIENSEAHARMSMEPPGVDKMRQQAIEESRKTIIKGLAEIKENRSKRDELFAQYSKQKSAVTLSPSKLLSSQGQSVDDLIAAVKNAATMRELSRLAAEQDTIRRELSDDIALVERLLKLNGSN